MTSPTSPAFPPAPGIYLATLSNGDHLPCLWNGYYWLYWSMAFDPHCWDPVEWINCHVTAWCEIKPPLAELNKDTK